MATEARKMVWDDIGERTYETGVDHGVLYLQENGTYPIGVPWNGLINVTESPSGAEDNALYADNIKYLNLKSAEDFGLTIECYTYPVEWNKCDGSGEFAAGVMVSQQGRKNFGLCYRTLMGNDTDNDSYGYKLHLAYGCSASPSERGYATKNDSPDALTFSYEVSTTPVNSGVDGFAPTALITIDSTKADPEKLKSLEEILYGKDPTTEGAGDGVNGRLPLPKEIYELFAAG